MSCERYKKALIEAAASHNDRPSDTPGEHLKSCDRCRDFFARERVLSAAMDLNLRRIAGAEIPPSLLGRLQAKLALESLPERSLVPGWSYAFAAASLLFIIVVAQYLHPWRNVATGEIATQISAPDSAPPTLQQGSNTILGTVGVRNHRFQPDARTRSRRHAENPEVLVQPDEEMQLVRFYEAMQARPHRIPAVVAQESDATVKALAIAPIEIALLEIKNLADRSDVSR